MAQLNPAGSHLINEIKGSKSTELANKRIVVCVTGSIAAVETVKLCRELIRHGAEVYAVMSSAAQKIICKDALEYATGNKVITEISGFCEHISLCGAVGKADLLIVAPATSNTIAKIATGISDTPVTTFATTALGSGIPVLMVPAMHYSMYSQKITVENIEKLQRIGVHFVKPLIEEGKAKSPPIENIVAEVIRIIGKRDFEGKRLLIIGGPAQVPVDDVRVLTNISTGKLAVALAENAYRRAANIDLWLGSGSKAEPPFYIETKRFTTLSDLQTLLKTNLKYDAILVPAALPDFVLEKKAGKIDSSLKSLSLTLMRAPKIIDIIRKKYKNLLVGFKLESGLTPDALIEKAYEKLKSAKLNLIVGCDVKKVSFETMTVYIIDTNKKIVEITDRKEIVAAKILDCVANLL